ncbi:MAG: hypothetical protein ABI876_10790, partial [Bacteroidota bacterium]
MQIDNLLPISNLILVTPPMPWNAHQEIRKAAFFRKNQALPFTLCPKWASTPSAYIQKAAKFGQDQRFHTLILIESGTGNERESRPYIHLPNQSSLRPNAFHLDRD